MKCLRTSVNSWDVGDTSGPMSIQCFLWTANSKKCQQCIERHEICELHYLVKWWGWPSEYNQWISKDAMANAPKIVAKYEAAKKKAK
ncbi:Chromo domain-like [Penicillium camemberti]|uniref:Chromo domain-like n=1 Tax=Penicillium camemberti (strain FM 013) TaxID=1429867 RepID=A0A0G4PAB5_PENC3|nr:Chromo domain-like [Penicillium camemberti]